MNANPPFAEAYTSIDGFTKPIRMQRQGEARKFGAVAATGWVEVSVLKIGIDPANMDHGGFSVILG
jgi:hypothetical protein